MSAVYGCDGEATVSCHGAMEGAVRKQSAVDVVRGV